MTLSDRLSELPMSAPLGASLHDNFETLWTLQMMGLTDDEYAHARSVQNRTNVYEDPGTNSIPDLAIFKYTQDERNRVRSQHVSDESKAERIEESFRSYNESFRNLKFAYSKDIAVVMPKVKCLMLQPYFVECGYHYLVDDADIQTYQYTCYTKRFCANTTSTKSYTIAEGGYWPGACYRQCKYNFKEKQFDIKVNVHFIQTAYTVTVSYSRCPGCGCNMTVRPTRQKYIDSINRVLTRQQSTDREKTLHVRTIPGVNTLTVQ
jgi:hypothetical protein